MTALPGRFLGCCLGPSAHSLGTANLQMLQTMVASQTVLKYEVLYRYKRKGVSLAKFLEQIYQFHAPKP